MQIVSIKTLGATLQLSHILAKAAENFDWDEEAKAAAIRGYLQHWYLAIKYPSVPLAAISKSADDLWHQHIIDTRKYMVDCQQILGTYMPHQPIYGKPTPVEQAAYEETIELYKREFGELPADIARTSGNYSYRPAGECD